MELGGRQEDESGRRVQVRFVTKLKASLKVPNTSIAIPSNLTRFGLSSVVNNLLQSVNPEWKPELFDFLINGELVRMSLEQFLLAKGISAEKVLEIEYIKAVVPQKEDKPFLHEDWVSAVDGSNSGFILTGSYDSLGRVWKAAGLCTHILEGHSGAVSSIRFLKSDGMKNVTIATASKDQTLRLWKIGVEELINHPKKIRAFKILRGHKASVQSIAAHTSGDMICSGSWDCTINLWQTNESDTEGDQVSTKKRKVNNLADESQLEGEAVSTLVGHTQCVSSVVWSQHETIYSASWDHSVRRWDVETGNDVSDIFCGKVLNCIDVGGEGSALIAAGGSDPILRIWDPRKPGTSAPVFQFSSHNSWISACKWHNNSWFHLVSASYDGKVMLWDLRTAWPLAVIDSHRDKVLCADWWRSDSILSGGLDSKLCISSGISIQNALIDVQAEREGQLPRIVNHIEPSISRFARNGLIQHTWLANVAEMEMLSMINPRLEVVFLGDGGYTACADDRDDDGVGLIRQLFFKSSKHQVLCRAFWFQEKHRYSKLFSLPAGHHCT